MSKFNIFLGLFAFWVVMFAVTIVTEARVMARGIMPLISLICTLWLAYWTISAIRSNGKSETKDQNATEKTSGNQRRGNVGKQSINKQ